MKRAASDLKEKTITTTELIKKELEKLGIYQKIEEEYIFMLMILLT